MSDTLYIFTLIVAALMAYVGVTAFVVVRAQARAEADETKKSVLVIFTALCALAAFCGSGWLVAALVAYV